MRVSWSIPVGMIFKRYYCSQCGEKLGKEKTHRVVTKDDVDYYKYHEHNTFPRRDIDVYEHRFKCNNCNSRITFVEQSIIQRIQKKNRKKILSSDEIKESYEDCKKSYITSTIISEILLYLFVILIFCITQYDNGNYDKTDLFIILGIILTASFTVFKSISRYKGLISPELFRQYTFKHECLMKKLHTYSSNNRELIEKSDKCYCFHCKSQLGVDEIIDYTDNLQTAICPKCGVDSIIPDAIEEMIDDDIIHKMNEYWF